MTEITCPDQSEYRSGYQWMKSCNKESSEPLSHQNIYLSVNEINGCINGPVAAGPVFSIEQCLIQNSASPESSSEFC